MTDADIRAAALAAQQLSLATHAQLLRVGLDEEDIRNRVTRKDLHILHRGVYRMPGAPPSYEQQVFAACLATDGVVSHRTAARLFGLRGFAGEQRIEISVPDRRATKLRGVVAHTSNLLESTFIGEIPVAMPAQVLLGLAEVGDRRAEGAVNDVLVKRLASLPTLVRFAQRQSARGRGGIVLLRELLEEQVRAGGSTESWLEDQVRDFLRERGCPEAIRGHWVGRRRLDFFWAERMFDLEADGRLWHTSPSDRRRDAARDAALGAAGIRVERVGWLELKEDPDGLEARLWPYFERLEAAA